MVCETFNMVSESKCVESFLYAVFFDDRGIFASPEPYPFKPSNEVRVTSGLYSGMRGYVFSEKEDIVVINLIGRSLFAKGVSYVPYVNKPNPFGSCI